MNLRKNGFLRVLSAQTLLITMIARMFICVLPAMPLLFTTNLGIHFCVLSAQVSALKRALLL